MGLWHLFFRVSPKAPRRSKIKTFTPPVLVGVVQPWKKPTGGGGGVCGQKKSRPITSMNAKSSMRVIYLQFYVDAACSAQQLPVQVL